MTGPWGRHRDHHCEHSAWKTGLEFANRNDNFPIGAIYLSEAGGDARLPACTTSVEITGNAFENNWGGIVGWETPTASATARSR